jgi:hypothetical protein
MERDQRGNRVRIQFSVPPDRRTPDFTDASGTPLLSGVEVGMRFPSLAVCGFRGNLFNALGAFCFDLPRVGTFSANCKSPKGFEYSIDRNSLLANETQKGTSDTVVDLVHSAYRNFLHATGAFNERSIYELNEESRTGSGNVFDVFTGTRLPTMYAKDPDLLCFKLIVVRLIPLASSNPEVHYLNVLDLASKGMGDTK